jgi:thiamine thiazole synthase
MTTLTPIPDARVSSLIVSRFFADLQAGLEADVIIVGAGPSGMCCAWTLADAGYRVTLLDRRLAPGGGIWGGAMGFNKVVLQKETAGILEEAKVPYEEHEDGALVVSSLAFASGLIAKAASHPNIHFFNLMTVVDLHFQGERAAGVVVNASAIELQGLHVDPLVFTGKAVLDATGHDAVLARLFYRRRQEGIAGENFMDAVKGERDVVENTRMIAPGLFVAGMAANNVFGGCRMGPIFGGMLVSGKKAAELIKAYLKEV